MPLNLNSEFLIEKNAFVCVQPASLRPGAVRCVDRVRPPTAYMFNEPSIWDVGDKVLRSVCVCVCVCVCVYTFVLLVVRNDSCPEQIFRVDSRRYNGYKSNLYIPYTIGISMGRDRKILNRNEQCPFIDLTKLY